ncbi:DNA-binding protein [Herbaspirillum sp.]|uniref:DNA-binding protein n=1 Tax=Herbaspirillum sp. TaxID=1890675 RepID=UPI001B29E7CD|nr:DNA-binding protein [Herbaspirillum sp.]MBO9538757.1 DNA-binding protein [Herbaspirillum sp.]
MTTELSFPNVDPELVKTLPPVLRAVVRALGFKRAKDWLALHGGVNVIIPAYRSTTLGLEADELARLRVTLAPHLDTANRCWLPKVDKLATILAAMRNAQIREERPHTSISKLARSNGLSSRQILNIIREDDDNPQLDLF